jgi:8-oxo-dGTP diphosphatase
MPFTRIELAVLSIVDGQLSVLLGLRAQAPEKGRWALPGGALRIDMDKDLEAAAQRVAKERLTVTLPFLRQLQASGNKTRDPRAPWALSIVYRAMLQTRAIAPAAGKRLDALAWTPVDQIATREDIAFDHQALIQAAVQTTRDEVEKLRIPFEYLPAIFTLGELQACCEAILGRVLDKSSFRRKLDDQQILQVVKGEMRTGAFRPAQLYRPVSSGA